jgi:DNA-binding beta-propeller fold protein YncE
MAGQYIYYLDGTGRDTQRGLRRYDLLTGKTTTGLIIKATNIRAFAIHPDGDTVYVSSVDRKKMTFTCEAWSLIDNAKIATFDVTALEDYAHPRISADGSTLVLAPNGTSTIATYDITNLRKRPVNDARQAHQLTPDSPHTQ